MGKSSTVQQSNAPNPVFMAAYSDLLSRAQGNANTPFQPNPFVTASGFAPMQQTAFSQIGSQMPYQAVAPYLKQANQYVGQANAPIWPNVQQFSPAAVNQYMSPYIPAVVGATEQQFQNINSQQMNQLAGNAASQGALGGSRAGAAEAILGGQQAAGEAPVIAGLYNQGYGQALQEFNTQQQAQLGATEAQRWLASQGAFASGQLGQENVGAAMGNINAELGAGAQQQQLAQARANIPAYNFYAQQAYPFQTTNFLAGITEGTGSLAGGTGSTTYPAPSIGSQLLGAGTAGAGILSNTGAFGNTANGNTGWLSNLFSGAQANPWDSLVAARGGRLHRMPGGGILSGMAGNQPVPTMMPMGPGMGMPMVPGGVPTGLSMYIPPQASSGARSPFVSQLMNPGTTSTTSGGGGGLGDILGLGLSIGKLFLNRGGGIIVPQHMLRRDEGGGVQYAGIHAVPEDDVNVDPMTGAVLPRLREFNQFPGSFGSPTLSPVGAAGIPGLAGSPSGAGVVPPTSPLAPPPAKDRGAQFAFPPQSGEPTFANVPVARPGLVPPPPGQPTFATISSPGTIGRGAGVIPPAAPSPSTMMPGSPSGGFGDEDADTSVSVGHGRHEPTLGDMLIRVGLGMMSGRSPNMGVNIGQGALEGLNSYEQMRARMAQEDLREEEAQWRHEYQTGRVDVSQQRADTYAQHTASNDAMAVERNKLMAIKESDRTAEQKDRMKYLGDTLQTRIDLGLGNLTVRQGELAVRQAGETRQESAQTQKEKMDEWRQQTKATDEEDAYARAAIAQGHSPREYPTLIAGYRAGRQKLGPAVVPTPPASAAAPTIAVGRTMTGPNGERVQWTGQTWAPLGPPQVPTAP